MNHNELSCHANTVGGCPLKEGLIILDGQCQADFIRGKIPQAGPETPIYICSVKLGQPSSQSGEVTTKEWRSTVSWARRHHQLTLFRRKFSLRDLPTVMILSGLLACGSGIGILTRVDPKNPNLDQTAVGTTLGAGGFIVAGVGCIAMFIQDTRPKKETIDRE